MLNYLADIWSSFYGDSGYNGDVNELKGFGFYPIGATATNKPFLYCVVLVFPYETISEPCCAQIAIERNVNAGNAPSLAVRSFRDNENYGWSDWKVL